MSNFHHVRSDLLSHEEVRAAANLSPVEARQHDVFPALHSKIAEFAVLKLVDDLFALDDDAADIEKAVIVRTHDQRLDLLFTIGSNVLGKFDVINIDTLEILDHKRHDFVGAYIRAKYSELIPFDAADTLEPAVINAWTDVMEADAAESQALVDECYEYLLVHFEEPPIFAED